MLRIALGNLNRRTVHTSTAVGEEWTKASLRRMKKPDLTRLAKEHNLKLSGTKNDIIIQLLTHQTAKIVGVETPSSLSLPKTKKQPAFGSLDKDSYSPDEDWVNAFEMKLSHRGSGKALDDAPKQSKPHHFNKQLNPSKLLHSEDLIISEKTPIFETIKAPLEGLDGMDPQWVEAFDLKVGSRGGRHELTDTLTAATIATLPTMESLEFISLDNNTKTLGKKFDHVKKHTEKHGKLHYHNDKKHAISKEKDNTENKAYSKKQDSIEEKVRIEKENHIEKQDPIEEKSHINKKAHIKNNHIEKKSSIQDWTEEKIVSKEINAQKIEPTTNTLVENFETIEKKDTNKDGNRETMISSAIGSSMLLWYLGGEEGLTKIWEFFS